MPSLIQRGASLLTQGNWGILMAKKMNQIAQDPQNTFPGVKKFSARNLWIIKNFYLYCLECKISIDLHPKSCYGD